MRFKFKDRKLEALYTSEKGAHKYSHSVVEAFFEAVAVIEAATDERDLRAIKSLHYEKLVGDRSGQRSLRLGGQFRLIVTPVKDEQGDIIWIIEIADYH
jgi:proteic killer suppression protein